MPPVPRSALFLSALPLVLAALSVAPSAARGPFADATAQVSAVLELSAALELPAAGEEVVESWPNGNPRRVYEVDEQGRKDGDFAEFRMDGELAIEAEYRAGELHGRYKRYRRGGEVELDCTYKKGLLDGRYRTFDAEGDVLVDGSYDEGRKDGRFEIRRGGDVVSRQKWVDGELVELDGFDDPFPRSVAALRAEIDAIRARTIEPVLESSYEGDIDPELAASRVLALKRLMEYRALSGLRYADMELDDKKNWHCSAAAKMLTIIGRLDHTPKNPGMPDEEYDVAYIGTSRSNLAMGNTLPGSIDGYMDDSDPSNIDAVGHRRWCLNPAMKETGFGIDGRFSAMWSFDESGAAGSWDHVAYPAPGYYPTSHFGDHHAFSVRFPGGVTNGKEPSDFVIEIAALDGDYAPAATLALDHVSISGGQLVFRAQGLACEPGRAYRVRIGEVGRRKPQPLLHYYVEFVEGFDADGFYGPGWVRPARDDADGEG